MDLPDNIPRPGLSRERQQILVRKIREFCSKDQQDRVCPQPSALLPLSNEDEEVSGLLYYSIIVLDGSYNVLFYCVL